MVEAGSGNILPLKEIKDPRKIRKIGLRNRVPQSHFQTHLLTGTNTSERGLKSTVNTTESIIRGLEAIETDANIRQAYIFEPGRYVLANQRAIR